MTLFSGIAGGILRVFRGDNLQNALTKFGTERSRTANTRVNGRRYLGLGELDSLQQMGIVQRVNGELPRDAVRPFTVTIPDNPALASATVDALDGLAVQQKYALAGKRAREYGGAALWIVCDGGGTPDQPLDLASVRSVKNLVLIDRFELSAQPVSNEPSYFVGDPANPAYGTPAAYYYAPSQGGQTQTIHASRLLRFYGDDVPERIRLGWYDGWGAPAIEGAYNSFVQLWAGQQAGAELINEFGHMIYTLDNLAEIMTGEARDELSEWMALQAEARSTLRATILGKGQSADRAPIPLAGWADIFAELKQMFASDVGMPMTKIFQQGVGGMSTTDSNALADWSARVKSWQDEQYRPALNALMRVLFASKTGPSRGVVPPEWAIEIEPYEVPTAREEADTTKLYADTVAILTDRKLMSAEDARETMRSKPGIVLGTEDAQDDPILSGDLRDDAEDSFTPPQAVRDNAQRALDIREGKPESQRGMTAVGLARARDLANGRAVSLDTIERMVSYFARHEVDKQGSTWGEQGKGWQAWQGWGGDEGRAWATRILERAERGDALRGDPYTATSPNLPDAVRAMSDAERDMWIRVFNAVLAESDEETAFRAAYSATQKP
jgi:phage-related protein (TIGR01555 family)